MSKSSKSARHGDDKNFQRKVTNAPQKLIFEGNLKQLHDSRNYPIAGTTKQSNVAGGRKFKSKLRSPSKPKTLQMPLGTNQVNHPQTTSSKIVDKRISLAPLPNSKHYGTMKVHQDSGETMIVLQTKASKKEMKQNKQLTTKADDSVEKEKETKVETGVESVLTTSTNGKLVPVVKTVGTELTEQKTDESTLGNLEKPTTELVSSESSVQDANEPNNEIDQITSDQNNSNGHNGDKPAEQELNEIVEKLEYNEVIVIAESENANTNKEEDDKTKEERPLTVPTHEDKESIVKLQIDESASDLVGSTTSESSPMKNTENQTDKQDNNTQAKETDDIQFVSYDSNIMLKDVKIKLNDCLKENTKLLDVTDPSASMSEASRDLSFGRTLRGISGRNSLRRMRHVTVREPLLTPNDSLFVNISGTSLLQDQSQYSELNADTPYHYSNRHDRKRKFDESINESMKKAKTDESYGLLNTSLEYLRNLRKPVQVSTPNAHGYKFNIDDKKTNEGDHDIVIEKTTEPKKWCIVM